MARCSGCENAEWRVRDKSLRPGEGHGRNGHRRAILTLVVFGRLDEGFDRGVQSCRPFELHYKPRGIPHTTSTGPDGVRMLLVGLEDRDIRLLGIRDPDRPRTLPGRARAARTLSLLTSLGSLEGKGDPMAADRIRRLRPFLEVDGSDHPTSRPPTWLTEVRERVASRISERLSLRRIGREFGVHPVYLARAFRIHYGETIGRLRRRLRVERAVVRLHGGRESLAELALELGYADQSHFTRELKRETGWTPARLRTVAHSLGRLGSSG